MPISVELLVHFQCSGCLGWWTVGDAPNDRLTWNCPWCGQQLSLEVGDLGLAKLKAVTANKDGK